MYVSETQSTSCNKFKCSPEFVSHLLTPSVHSILVWGLQTEILNWGFISNPWEGQHEAVVWTHIPSMLMASCTQKFETPLRKGLTNTNHHVAYAYQSTAAKKNCSRQEISKLKSVKYILSYKISWVAQIILNFQFYISHIRLKSVTIGKKKIFAASKAAILSTKEYSNATAKNFNSEFIEEKLC